MSENRVLIACWDCSKKYICRWLHEKRTECADYNQQPKRPGPERPPDRHWYKVVPIEIGEQATDNTPLTAEERAAIAERLSHWRPNCETGEYHPTVTDMHRLLRHVEVLEGENTVLREMGQFYADENHHVRPTIPGKVYYGRDAEPSVVDVDRGQKAREALGT